MNWKTYLFLNVALFVIVRGNDIGGPKHGKVAVCYIESWAMFRVPPVKFETSDIDPTLCTHIVYAFAGLDEQSLTIKSINQWLDVESNNGTAGYQNLTEIKKNHPHIKVTLGVGGWHEGSAKFSKMAADKKLRKKFITSVIQCIVKYEFDGIDIMWKHPTTRGGSPEDKENFITLIKELKAAFLLYGFILTASISNNREILNSGYDLVNLNRYLDLIHVLSYDYYGAWSKVLGPIASLKTFNNEYEKNVEYTIKYMLAFGVSPQKLVLGIPFHGLTFILTEPDIKDIEFGKSTTKNHGFTGPYTNGNNSYGYNEVCLVLKNQSNWTYHWDKNSSTPYIRDGNRVVSYENTRSIANKVKFAIDNELGGFMVWSMDTDDFKGICDMPNDTYTDFIDRYNGLINENTWQEALNNIYFSQGEIKDNLKWKTYENLRDKLIHLQKQKFINYPLLRTIHQTIEIVLEEKDIADAIKRATPSLKEATHKLSRAGNSDTLSTPCVRTCTEICFYGTEF